jgi:purine-binding chemotaxis protein CheW
MTKAAEAIEILMLDFGGQRYGLPATCVHEVLRAVVPVPLPNAPAIVEGVINVHGSIIPVFDMRQRIGLPSKQLDHTDHLVVASAGARRVALHVDRATHLLQLEAADLEDAKRASPAAEYIAWIAKLPDDLVLIQDLRNFLSRTESDELDSALAASLQDDQP